MTRSPRHLLPEESLSTWKDKWHLLAQTGAQPPELAPSLRVWPPECRQRPGYEAVIACMAQAVNGPQREMFVPEKAGDQPGTPWLKGTGYATECDDDLTINRRRRRRGTASGEIVGWMQCEKKVQTGGFLKPATGPGCRCLRKDAMHAGDRDEGFARGAGQPEKGTSSRRSFLLNGEFRPIAGQGSSGPSPKTVSRQPWTPSYFVHGT